MSTPAASNLRTFLDVRDVVGFRNVRWRTLAAEKRTVGDLEPEALYTSSGIGYSNAVADGNKVRLWYQPCPKEEVAQNPTLVAYAESPDGVRWRTEKLGIKEYAGNRESNLTNLDLHCPSIIRNPRSDHPDERWLAVGVSTEPWGFLTVHSADGLRWKPCTGTPIYSLSDVGTFVYDEYRGRFLGTPKMDVPVRLSSRRAIAISTSEDFHHWTDPQLALVPDEMDDDMAREGGFHHCDFYGMSLLPLPEMLLGFLWVFWIREPLEPGTGPGGHHRSGHGVFGVVDVQLVYSYDGFFWRRSPGRQTLIPTGRVGDFDGGGVYPCVRPIVRDGDLWVYYSGDPVEHGVSLNERWQQIDTSAWWRNLPKPRIGLAVFPRFRLACFSALEDGVVEVSIPKDKPIDRLWINARCPYGYVKAAVLDRNSLQPVAGLSMEHSIPFVGDEGFAEVGWRGASITDAPAHRSLFLRFALRNADLFSYGFE